MNTLTKDICAVIDFPAARIGSQLRPTRFGRNLELLRKLHIGFSPAFGAALKDPQHPLSQFLGRIDLRRLNADQNRTAAWLTELSYQFDLSSMRRSLSGSVIRIISRKLNVPVRGRNYALDFNTFNLALPPLIELANKFAAAITDKEIRAEARQTITEAVFARAGIELPEPQAVTLPQDQAARLDLLIDRAQALDFEDSLPTIMQALSVRDELLRSDHQLSSGDLGFVNDAITARAWKAMVKEDRVEEALELARSGGDPRVIAAVEDEAVKVLVDNCRYDEAHTLISGIDNSSRKATALLRLATAQPGFAAEAENALEELEDLNQMLFAQLTIAEIYFNSARPEESRRLLGETNTHIKQFTDSPEKAQLLFLHAQAASKCGVKAESVIDELLQARRILAGPTADISLALLKLNIAAFLYGLGRKEEITATVDEISAGASGSAIDRFLVHKTVAKTLYELGLVAEALDIYRRLLDYLPRMRASNEADLQFLNIVGDLADLFQE